MILFGGFYFSPDQEFEAHYNELWYLDLHELIW